MHDPDFFPPLRLVTDHGEEVFPAAQFDPKVELDPGSPPPIPIRPDIEIDLDPDFPDF